MEHILYVTKMSDWRAHWKRTVCLFNICFCVAPIHPLGFPSGTEVKNPPANAGDSGGLGLIPGSGRSAGGGHGYPLQCSCLENPMDRGAWKASVLRVTKSWTRQWSEHTHPPTPHLCMCGPCTHQVPSWSTLLTKCHTLSLLVRAWTRLHPAGICMFGGSNLVLNLHEWEALTVCSLEGRAPQSSEIPIPFSPLYLHLLQSPRPQRTGITFAYFLDLHYSSYSTPVFLLGNPMDREAWRTTVHGAARIGHNLMTKQQQQILID